MSLCLRRMNWDEPVLQMADRWSRKENRDIARSQRLVWHVWHEYSAANRDPKSGPVTTLLSGILRNGDKRAGGFGRSLGRAAICNMCGGEARVLA
jgi:hypothetical protein